VFPSGEKYEYLGDWSARANNRPIEEGILVASLEKRGYSREDISAALRELSLAADVTDTTLYNASFNTYKILRYGVKVKTNISGQNRTVHLIDWQNPEANHFGIAEEVTLKGNAERRPDIVIYVNGIAVAILELKRASVDITDGIRQLISNQEDTFNKWFFPTVQLLIAGSDSQGLRYGTVTTPEEFFVEWKSEARRTQLSRTNEGELLDAPAEESLEPARLLDIIRNFVIFDGGRKKVPRQHQYLGIKAAQQGIAAGKGGVIWHTQGSGKSILMVLLAKWILEQDHEARILVITDRDELDDQIGRVMIKAGVVSDSDTSSFRVTSRREFVERLRATTPRILCALLHKFEPDFEAPSPMIHGKFYVFVDECHRTQGGNMNKQMKAWLKGAIFVGFTGTPLLRKDKKTTQDVFGNYLHTYKFHEAVADGVVLDLKYEARDVPQQLKAAEEIDKWFQAKTKGLNDYQSGKLKSAWANMGNLMSAQERKSRIIASIILDFETKPRLSNDRGTAILVAASIYDACHYFRLLQGESLGAKCGLVTSYEPNPAQISKEPKNSDERYKFETYTKYVLKNGQTTTAYEDEVKRRFIEEPADMKLLIVVSKLLTGFDAPSCTYIYLDQELRDHNLFQAICRTNRLDGDDKDYGYIVDFKELFGNVQEAISVYTSEELDTEGASDKENNVEIKNWLTEGKKKLEDSRKDLRYLVEPVPPPQDYEQYILYFCGDASDPDALDRMEPLRVSFYKLSAKFIRAYGAIALDIDTAGFSREESLEIEKEVLYFSDLRAAIKNHAGEELDVKAYEADMRHLINTYVQADHAQSLGELQGATLTEAIVTSGINDAVAKKLNSKGKLSNTTIAEGVINNLRKTISQEKLADPRFYEKMSKLLEELIKQDRESADAYKKWLATAQDLATQILRKGEASGIPELLRQDPQALNIFNNLEGCSSSKFLCPTDPEERASLAAKLAQTVRDNAQRDWRTDNTRASQMQNALYQMLDSDEESTMKLFELVKNIKGFE
jgi:type I restriction enzyme R subunit